MLFIEFDFWRINKTDRWERDYYIELRNETATTRVRFFWGTDIHGKPQVFGVHTGEGTPYENVRVANMLWNADRPTALTNR